MFGPRARHIRDYLHDASIRALEVEAKRCTGMRGDPRAAAAARLMAAGLADMRDALDVRAPWLRDSAKVLAVVEEIERHSIRCDARLEFAAADIAALVCAQMREEPSEEGDGEVQEGEDVPLSGDDEPGAGV